MSSLLQKVLGMESIQFKFLKMVGNKRIYFRDLPTYLFVFSILWLKSGQPICFFYKIEPKRKETKKTVTFSCFNFAGIQQSILLILSSLDPHFQALTDSVISLGYSPLNPLPFPYCTVWSNMSFFVPLGFLLKLPPNKISV